jgi:negative regulator of sigma E activity
MSKENKGYSSIKLACRDFRAEGTGLGVAAVVVIVVIVVLGLVQGVYTL